MSNQGHVEAFMLLTGCTVRERPQIISEEENALRLKLIDEEVRELHEAVGNDNLVEIADALADLLYVTYGYALTLGIDINRIFSIVHASNMAKAPGGVVTRREDGKVLKPEGWVPPTEAIADELVRQKTRPTDAEWEAWCTQRHTAQGKLRERRALFLDVATRMAKNRSDDLRALLEAYAQDIEALEQEIANLSEKLTYT